jgi:cardiolipin synthase
MDAVLAQLDGWSEALARVWTVALAVVDVTLALVASAHIVLAKRDARAAMLWVGLVWLAPVIGAVLYLLIGINRIKRRDVALHSRTPAAAS